VSQAVTYEFGPFRVDAARYVVLRQGKPVSLAPKAFEVLVALAESGGRLVRRDDLTRKVWPDTFAEEANLTVVISTLQKALGEAPDGHSYIEVVPKIGYRFNAVVRRIGSEPFSVAAMPEMPRNPGAGAGKLPGGVPGEGDLADAVRRRARAASRRRILVVKAVGAIAFLALIAAGVHLRIRRKAQPVAANTAERSIAVLPFQPLGVTPDQEYLGLALTDALIARLGSLRQLVVRPTSTVGKYQNSYDPLAAGRALKVDSVLDGSVQRSGERVRVSVRLMRVADGAQLWSDTLDEQFTNMFAVEDSISQQVTRALAVQLSGADEQQLTKQYTQNSDAYQLYLKGRFFWGKRTPAGVQQSIGYFQRAIALDPRYALAYAGLADADLLEGSSGYSELSPREAMPKAIAAAERALALDDTLGEAHTSLAYAKLIYAWDWPGAEREFKRALELNPSNTTALHWYSHYLTAMGRHAESIAEAKRALEINPVDLSLNEHLSWTYLMARQYDAGIEQCRRTLEMDPTFALAHRRLGEAYEDQHKFPEAVEEFQKGLELSGGAIMYKALLARAEAESGRRDEALQALAALKQLAARQYVAPSAIAEIYMGLGDRDDAFHWLQKAFEDRSDALAYAKVDPAFDSLRSDPRWALLLKRLGLD